MKILNLLYLLILISCATNVKKSVRFQEIALGSDEFSSVFFNVIEIKSSEGIDYIINTALSYEAPGKLEIVLEKEKPLLLAIDKNVETLLPVPNKYKYQTRKVSEGERVLHIQTNDYKISKELLMKILNAKSVVVKVPAAPHKDKGFDGVFRTESLATLKEFLE